MPNAQKVDDKSTRFDVGIPPALGALRSRSNSPVSRASLRSTGGEDRQEHRQRTSLEAPENMPYHFHVSSWRDDPHSFT